MPAALVRDRTPYPLPPLGAPVRVAFLGAAATSAAHALHEPAGGLAPRFVDARTDARAALAEFAPHVVVALAPELVPPHALDGLQAAKLAVAPPAEGEAGDSAARPGATSHGRGGAERAGAASRAAGADDVTLASEPFAAYDRVLRLPGPHGAAGAWRSRPLPVDDRLYLDVGPSGRPPRALCVARSTDHREWVLTPAKHSFDVVHYTHGLVGDALRDELQAADAGIALTADPGHGFPPQALLHLAAGHLLLTERLHPTCGLEPGIDFLELDSRDSLVTILMQLRLRPDSYERVRIRGRLKAEEHRASKVWPRIVHDLIHDIGVFGAVNTLRA